MVELRTLKFNLIFEEPTQYFQVGKLLQKMSDSGSVGNSEVTRVKGVTVVKPIVYGSVSQPFGKKRENDGHTHEWTIYVKPYTNEDMSAYVKKVQFRLHDSYANCNRIVSKPPYEVSSGLTFFSQV